MKAINRSNVQKEILTSDRKEETFEQDQEFMLDLPLRKRKRKRVRGVIKNETNKSSVDFG
jgi:hypothetical protein